MINTDYHAKYYAYDLTKRCASDSIEKFVSTLSEAKVQLNPHQIDAALFAFKSPLSKGAILADEVGLGKTIEAGIVISQYWAERKKKILIIMPASLRKQWQQELEDKFFLPTFILESKSFNNEINKGNFNPFDQEKIIICSYQFARNKAPYISKLPWDLVVIDEAHRLRNVYKSNSKIANAIKKSIENRNKILLTATPLQNSLLELYGLVSIIDEYTFGNLQSFKYQYCAKGQQADYLELKRRITTICQRTLRKQVLEYVKYTNRIAITEEFSPTEEEQKLYDGISEYLLKDKLYALNGGQRKLMTLILRRLLASSTFAISGTIGKLVQKLQSIIDNNQDDVNESMELELEENIETYDSIREEWIDDEEEDEDENLLNQKSYSPEEINEIKIEKKYLEGFYDLAKKIDKNAKGEKLLTALEKGFMENSKNGGNQKALIFTESVRTQKYLYEILQNTKYKNKIILFNGSNNDQKSKEIYAEWLDKYKGTDKISGSKTADKRAALVDYFKNEAEIMIATEAAAEGINLQFCSLVVNYDLPWNPQRIEQRIGRCHRYGQKHDVVVVNFLNKKNAADVRVYELLNEKFQLFDGVFGASDEVLGAIGSGLDFEKRIVEILQSCRSENDINQAFSDLRKSLETNIDKKMLDTRKKLFENFDIEVAKKLKLSKDDTERYLDIFQNKLWEITKYTLNDAAIFDDKNKTFKLKNISWKDLILNKGTYKLGKDTKDQNTYRIGHPFAQKVLNICKQKDLAIKKVIFDYTNNKLVNVSILKDLVGQTGWLVLKKLTITALEDEDFLLFAGYTDSGATIDSEQCKKMFLFNAQDVIDTDKKPNLTLLSDLISKEKTKYEDVILEKNYKFYDDEIDKLDNWATDQKESLEICLNKLDEELKIKRKEAKRIIDIKEKIKAQKEIISLETKRKNMRNDLYKSQDEVEKQKQKLIEKIEARLQQTSTEEELFTIRWELI